MLESLLFTLDSIWYFFGTYIVSSIGLSLMVVVLCWRFGVARGKWYLGLATFLLVSIVMYYAPMYASETRYHDALYLPIRVPYNVTQAGYSQTIDFCAPNQEYYSFNIIAKTSIGKYDYKHINHLEELAQENPAVQYPYLEEYQQDSALHSDFEDYFAQMSRIGWEDAGPQVDNIEVFLKNKYEGQTPDQFDRFLKPETYILTDLLIEKKVNNHYEHVALFKDLTFHSVGFGFREVSATLKKIKLSPGQYRATVTNKLNSSWYQPFEFKIEIDEKPIPKYRIS